MTTVLFGIKALISSRESAQQWPQHLVVDSGVPAMLLENRISKDFFAGTQDTAMHPFRSLGTVNVRLLPL